VRRHALVAIVLCAALAGACGGSNSSAPPPAAAPSVDLRVTASDGRPPARRARIRCTDEGARTTGFLRERSPARVCAAARRLGPFLATPPDRDRVCTQQYGGRDEARIAGRVGQREVARAFARRDGCEIADWDRARALLPRA
jgi:hypothetical protein